MLNLEGYQSALTEAKAWVDILERPWVVVAFQYSAPYAVSLTVHTEMSKPGDSGTVVACVSADGTVAESDWLKSQLKEVART